MTKLDGTFWNMSWKEKGFLSSGSLVTSLLATRVCNVPRFLVADALGTSLLVKTLLGRMKTVRDGRVCINVNGERSNYFRTYRGLR